MFCAEERLQTELFNDSKYRNALLEKGETQKHEMLKPKFG